MSVQEISIIWKEICFDQFLIKNSQELEVKTTMHWNLNFYLKLDYLQSFGTEKPKVSNEGGKAHLTFFSSCCKWRYKFI